MSRLGSDQYTYRTVERRISTASVALGLARMSMPGTQYQLTNLKKFTRYSVVVQAYNVLGQGPMTPEVVATTLEDGKEEERLVEFFFPSNDLDFVSLWIWIFPCKIEIILSKRTRGRERGGFNEHELTPFVQKFMNEIIAPSIRNSAMNTNRSISARVSNK